MENPIEQTQPPIIEASFPPSRELNTTNPTSPLPTSQPPANQNIWKIATGVLGLLLIVGGLTFAFVEMKKPTTQNMAVVPSPSPTVQPSATPSAGSLAVLTQADPTANWKTVSNKFWTFKVPQTLNYVECNPESYDQVLIGLPTAAGGLFNKDKVMTCNFDVNGELLTLDRNLDNSDYNIVVPTTNTDPKLDPVVANSQIITVDGVKATLQQETTSMGQFPGTRYKVYIHQSNYMDVITFNDINQKNLLDQILSTFKFTSQKQTDSTASWKTYSDSTYGFEFQYPSKYIQSTDLSGWPHSLVLFNLANGQSYSLVVEHWNNLAEFQQTYSTASYFKDFTVFTNPKGGVITILNLDKVDAPNDPDPAKVISTFKFTN